MLRPTVSRRKEARTGSFHSKAGFLARVVLFFAPIAAVAQGAGAAMVFTLVVLFLVAHAPIREAARQARRVNPLPEIHAAGLLELREDLLNAVMVACLLQKGEHVPADRRGKGAPSRHRRSAQATNSAIRGSHT